METLFRSFRTQLEHTSTEVVRFLHDQIAWDSRLVAILGARGVPLRTDDMVLLGNNQPKWMMGWSNTLSYKNFVLNFMFDMRYGGDVYMGSIRAGASSGNLEMTLEWSF